MTEIVAWFSVTCSARCLFVHKPLLFGTALKKIYCQLIAAVVSLIALQSAAVTLHRSFCTREAGFGFGTGKATVAYPVDSRVAAALDEADEKNAAKIKVIIGKCTRASDGDTIHVVTGGNVKYKVRLDRIDAPEKDQPYGKESTAYLSSLIRFKTVRVEWQKKDQYGRILGIVYTQDGRARTPAAPQPPQNETALVKGWYDINLHLVAIGNAWHYSHFDKTAEYATAEAEARQNRRGLWSADEKPVNPCEWRRSKRKM